MVSGGGPYGLGTGAAGYVISKGGKTVQLIYKGGKWVVNKVVGKGVAKATRESLLELASNQKLKNAIDQIYRPGAKTGDGGLADAIRHELKTGELVRGKSHLTKGAERIKNLENIINKQKLNPSDKAIAERLLNDLKNVMGVNDYEE